MTLPHPSPLLQKERETATLYSTRDDCRMCGSEALGKIWSFGETPLANAYLKPEEVGKDEPMAPLNVYYCEDCSLVQLRDVVDPKVMFDHYLYVSSTSPTFVKHFEDYAATLIERFKLDKDSFVVDVGSNDGILLKPLRAAGVKVLGVDPAENVAALANADGIPTRADYFVPEVAKSIAADIGQADIISANNVFAHTDHVDSFTEGVKLLLADDGVFVFEVQYLGDLIAKNLFDIVYHEHVNYYSVHPLVPFFNKYGLEVFDVERMPVHGGSIRVFIQHKGGPHERADRLDEILQEEEEAGLTGIAPYEKFAGRIEANKEKLQAMLKDIKAQGKSIVGYGAPAKATTLCYAFGLDGELIDYIVDDDEKIKQGLVMPGTHIPIVSPDYLYGREPHYAPPEGGATRGTPDYCVIMAWNFAEPIMANHERFTAQGGKWILPVPEPRVISN